MINVVAVALLQVAAAQPRAVPFGVGESFEYSGSIKALLSFGAGGGTLSVAGIDTLHGVPVYRFNFKFHASAPFYKNTSDMTSWTGVNDFLSRRLVKHVKESNYSKDEAYAIHGDSGFYRNELDGQTTPTPEMPVDDIALFYYIRTIPLTVGKTTTLNNFFRKDRNPVIINVLKREECDLPNDVKAMCLVLNPIVEDEPHGMFMKKRDARLWITDDARRIPVQIRADIGLTMTLKLSKMTLVK